jgi:hypothetical protein
MALTCFPESGFFMIKRVQLASFPGKWFFLLVVLIAQAGWADNPKISYPPVPAWVQPVEWKAATNWSRNAKSEGSRYLLYEEQDRPKNSEEFERIILLMENESGVQDSGSLSFNFDPDFQELLLHRVVIHRDGKVIDRLNQSKVRLVQPEPELGNHMFTGRQTAVLFVEDLRVGDALEYAYTIRGANPILGGHYASRFVTQFGSPIERELFRVVWDDPAPLHQRMHLNDSPPATKPYGNGWEYTWNFTNLAAISYEDHRPAGCEPYPYVELSDFGDWGVVVNWALPLYNPAITNLPVDLLELIARWENSAGSNEEKARLALRFVQDDLRYTGIELGPDSYRPIDPVETFEKRFGDCKAKVALLRLMLQRMNIEAWPALVNSSVQEAIAGRLPTPFAFNHVILKMELDGKTVWVDPTYSHQGGTMWNHYLPPYGKALVVRAGNHALEDVPRSRPENAWQQEVVSTFSIKDYDSPAALAVRTEYRGASADDMREQISSAAPEDFAKNYLNYYARLYPGIVSDQPLKFTDDRPANIVTIEEAYTITNLWKRDQADKLWKASFFADNLNHYLTDPDTRLRKTPLALSYPSQRRHDIIVHLPDSGWQIPDIRTNIEHEAFSFNYHSELVATTVTYVYECRTKLSAVPVELVPGYLARRDQMEDLLTDSLERSDSKAATVNGINWLMVVIAIFSLGFVTAGGIWYWVHTGARSRRLPPILVEDGPFQGLGGWLILVGFGLCLSPFVRIITIGQNWEGYFSIQVWQSLALPQGASYHPLYAPLLIMELLGNMLLLGLNLLALGFFFAKRRVFPGLFITLILCNALFLILDDVGCSLIPSLAATASGKSHAEAIRATIYAMIWSLYMVRSRRVKATFIR